MPKKANTTKSIINQNTVYMKKIALLLVAAQCTFFSLSAQTPGGRMDGAVIARLFPQGVNSPEINNDGSVTFRFQGPNAQKVELNCQMFEGNKPMEKDEKGVWSITVTPEKPDIYPYCFIVDGTQVADPQNPEIFPNEGFKNSIVDVKGPQPTMQDVQKVPHGKVTYKYYHSDLGFDRPMCVYTPAGYNPAEKTKYPVLYLIHGMTDTYETWWKVGRANVILDNLIAQGLAKKMIVVMPYANPYPEMQRRKLTDRYDPMNTEIVVKEIINNIKPYIESNYNVYTDADNRAVAGFSLGGRQTLATGLGHPELFHYVCAFSPAIFGNEWNTNFDNGTYSAPEKINKEVKYLWVSCGTADGLCSASRGLDTSLTEKGIKHTAHFSDGGHTWMNCRDYLETIAQKLFK